MLLLSSSALLTSLLYRRVSLLVILSIVFLVAITTVTAQEPDDVIKVRTDLVIVPASVTDSRGRRVLNLSQSDFIVRSESGPMRLDYFSIGTQQIALAFLLDASGSAREYLLKQREAALSLFTRFGLGSEVAVLPFAEKILSPAVFTDDIEKARSSFLFPSLRNRRTAIFDSAKAGLEFFAKRRPQPTERRIMVLTSDGLDTASTTKPADVVAKAQLEGISIYVIHFPVFSPRASRLEARPPTKGFRELALQTGGQYFEIGDARSALSPNYSPDLAPVFKAIEEDLAGQYLLGFYPDEASRDGHFHCVTVEVKPRTGRRLRVRSLRAGFILK